MNKLLFFTLIILNTKSFSQPTSYSVANAHSHNDYEQPAPFITAYQEAFGSIEADIFWHNGELLVAHTAGELAGHRTLEELYLKPLQACIEKNRGHIYADSTRRLQLMIDIKTEAVTTLNKLVELLQKYLNCLKINNSNEQAKICIDNDRIYCCIGNFRRNEASALILTVLM